MYNIYMSKIYIRKATRAGRRSLSVVIPSDIVDEMKIREKQKLVVRRSGSKIIRDVERWICGQKSCEAGFLSTYLSRGANIGNTERLCRGTVRAERVHTIPRGLPRGSFIIEDWEK